MSYQFNFTAIAAALMLFSSSAYATTSQSSSEDQPYSAGCFSKSTWESAYEKPIQEQEVIKFKNLSLQKVLKFRDTAQELRLYSANIYSVGERKYGAGWLLITVDEKASPRQYCQIASGLEQRKVGITADDLFNKEHCLNTPVNNKEVYFRPEDKSSKEMLTPDLLWVGIAEDDSIYSMYGLLKQSKTVAITHPNWAFDPLMKNSAVGSGACSQSVLDLKWTSD